LLEVLFCTSEVSYNRVKPKHKSIGKTGGDTAIPIYVSVQFEPRKVFWPHCIFESKYKNVISSMTHLDVAINKFTFNTQQMAVKYTIYDQMNNLVTPSSPILIVDEDNQPLGNITNANV